MVKAPTIFETLKQEGTYSISKTDSGVIRIEHKEHFDKRESRDTITALTKQAQGNTPLIYDLRTQQKADSYICQFLGTSKASEYFSSIAILTNEKVNLDVMSVLKEDNISIPLQIFTDVDHALEWIEISNNPAKKQWKFHEETDEITYGLDKNNVAHIIPKNLDFIKPHSWAQTITKLNEVSQQKSALIFDIRDSQLMEESDEDFDTSLKNVKLEAAAVLMGKTISRTMANFFMKLKSSIGHIYFFHSEKEAIKWLDNYYQLEAAELKPEPLDLIENQNPASEDNRELSDKPATKKTEEAKAKSQINAGLKKHLSAVILEPVHHSQQQLVSSLIQMGIMANGTPSIDEAVRMVNTYESDLLLISVAQDPDATLKVISQLKTNPKHSQLKIVPILSEASVGYADKFKSVGLGTQLVKPFTSTSLVLQLNTMAKEQRLFTNGRLHIRIRPATEDNANIFFRNTTTGKAFTGTIFDLSLGAVAFRPNVKDAEDDIEDEQILNNIKISIRNMTIKSSGKVLSKRKGILIVKLFSMEDLSKAALTRYISANPDLIVA